MMLRCVTGSVIGHSEVTGSVVGHSEVLTKRMVKGSVHKKNPAMGKIAKTNNMEEGKTTNVSAGTRLAQNKLQLESGRLAMKTLEWISW